MAKSTAMAFINGRMEISTKANGSTVSRLARAQTFLKMVMSLLASMKTENRTVSAPINGRMVLHTLESLLMASRMVSENGRKMDARTVICMKASFGMI